jgi:hypothetical protein
MALLALTEENRHTPIIDSTVRFLHAQQTAEGTWNSYWWRTDLYPTAISIAALAAIGAVLPTAPRLAEKEANGAPHTPFEVALLLRILVSLGRTDENASLLERLRGMQLHDGSWRSYPTLRVTNQNVQDPWAKTNAGTVYCDDRRLFTTATVLYALLCAEPGGKFTTNPTLIYSPMKT